VILGERALEEIGTGQALRASEWIPPGARLLEIGCSSGYLTRRFLARGGEVVGCDINRTALRQARLRLPAVPFACGEAERLPFADGSFDAIVMLEVIEHTSSDAWALSEVRRVLRAGGVLILSTPHRGLFAWLDPHNLRKGLEKRFPRACAFAARRVRFESGQFTANLDYHRHYRLEEIARLLGPDFVLRRVHHGGLLLSPLAAAAISLVGRLCGETRALRVLLRILNWDFHVPFGTLSYNLMLLAEKRAR